MSSTNFKIIEFGNPGTGNIVKFALNEAGVKALQSILTNAIDDSSSSNNITWSASKIEQEINKIFEVFSTTSEFPGTGNPDALYLDKSTNSIFYWDNENSQYVNIGIGSGSNGGAVDSVNGLTGNVILNSDNILEGSQNLYFTETNFNNAFQSKSTDDLPEGAQNKYFSIDAFNDVFQNKTTDNLLEGSQNLYFTDSNFNNALQNITTDNLAEGSQNLYFTETNFNNVFQNKSTDDLAEGSQNKYFTETNFNNAFQSKSTDDLQEGGNNKYFSTNAFDNAFQYKTTDDLQEGSQHPYFTETNFNNALQNKTTDNLAEGAQNKYFTETNFNNAFQSKSTDDLAEGSQNKYFTETNFNNAFQSKSTDDLPEGAQNKYYTETNFNISFQDKSTDDLEEGTVNKYFTQANFNNAFQNKTTDDLTEGTQNLYYTDQRVLNLFTNKSVLDSINEDTNGNLTYNGGPVGASGPTSISLKISFTYTFNTTSQIDSVYSEVSGISAGNFLFVSGDMILNLTGTQFQGKIVRIASVFEWNETPADGTDAHWFQKDMNTTYTNYVQSGNIRTMIDTNRTGSIYDDPSARTGIFYFKNWETSFGVSTPQKFVLEFVD